MQSNKPQTAILWESKNLEILQEKKMYDEGSSKCLYIHIAAKLFSYWDKRTDHLYITLSN